jgi:hypothetical protein
MINPFNKSIKDLKLEDLDLLIEAKFCESMFIEYKSDWPSNEKIAKAIAGFANSHGGFLIIGTDRNCGKDELPSSFPGANGMPTQPKDAIRNICRDHISPMPIYQAKFLEVDESRGVLVIQVDESMDTPHINRDGKIYRRQSSGTDSIPETSRDAIDSLYTKGKSGEVSSALYIHRKLNHFKLHDNQPGKPYFSIEIVICPLPIREIIPDLFSTKPDYRGVLPNTGYNFNVDVDSIYYLSGTYYEEIDTKGCITTQYLSDAIPAETMTGLNVDVKYKSAYLILPNWIEDPLRNSINASYNLFKNLSDNGIDHFGKIRIKMVLRNVKNKVLYYKERRTHYADFAVKFCRHDTLAIPDIDCQVVDLEKYDVLSDRILIIIRRGFNLPF